MTKRDAPILSRNDPNGPPMIGNVKVTRKDWLNLARDVLVTDGVAELKILNLSRRLGVSRSSFYWYFKGRAELLSALLDEWEVRNSQSIIDHCDMPADEITGAACNFFRCFVNEALFDSRLDFAVREWARRDPAVRVRIDLADGARLSAIHAMFLRHGYKENEADARARILYFMQLGYHALDVRETMPTRMGRLPEFLFGFTGVVADAAALAEFTTYAQQFEVQP